MRKLIMWNLMSLDGFFEGPNRDISWHSDVWGPELEQLSIEQGKEIGALLFGRVTYELMAGYWPTAKKSDRGLHEFAAEICLLAHSEEGGLGEHDASDGRPRVGGREAEARGGEGHFRLRQRRPILAPHVAFRRVQDWRRAALSRFGLAALQEAGRKCEAETTARRPAFDRRRHPAFAPQVSPGALNARP